MPTYPGQLSFYDLPGRDQSSIYPPMPGMGGIAEMRQNAEAKRQAGEKSAAGRPLDLTLGIELEFMLAECSYPDTHSTSLLDEYSSGKAKQLIRRILEEPSKLSCASCGKQCIFRLPVNQPFYSADSDDESDSDDDDVDDNFDAWTVGTDSSMSLTEDEIAYLGDNKKYFRFHKIEIKSRILDLQQGLASAVVDRTADHVHEIHYHEEIEAVVTKLHQALGSPSSQHDRFRLIVNESCGFHVHVGNQQRGFPLRTLKNAISTYVANERAIDALHSADRIGGSSLPLHSPRKGASSGDLDKQAGPTVCYNMPWSAHFARLAYRLRSNVDAFGCIARQLPDIKPPYPESAFERDEGSIRKAAFSFDVKKWLTLIQSAETIKELQQLQSFQSHQSTVDAANLHDYCPENFDTPSTMTIEFRQHAGTLELSEIHAWVDTVQVREWRAPNYYALNFVRSIGCSSTTTDFYKHKLGHVNGSWSYADDLAHKEMQNLNAFSKSGMITPLMAVVAQKRRTRMLPSKVFERINQKFKQAGYGLFSAQHLQDQTFVPLEPALRAKLTIASSRPRLTSGNAARNRKDPSDNHEAVSQGAISAVNHTAHAANGFRAPAIMGNTMAVVQRSSTDMYPHPSHNVVVEDVKDSVHSSLNLSCGEARQSTPRVHFRNLV